MTKTNFVTVYSDIEGLYNQAAADASGRVAVFTHIGPVSFYPVGDILEARTTEAQADYLCRTEGYFREGEESKKSYRKAVESWIEEGRKLYEQRQFGAKEKGAMNPFVAIFEAMGGPEEFARLMYAHSGAGLVEQAKSMSEEAAAKAEEARKFAEEAKGWTFSKLDGRLDVDFVHRAIQTYDPALQISNQTPINSLISRLAQIANTNIALSQLLTEELEKGD